MIELKNICKDFDVYGSFSFSKRASINILNDINCIINESEAIGIIGKNGSGKSTLLKIIFGAILPDQGNVLLNGELLNSNDTFNSFSFLGNNDRSFFWRLSVEDNIRYFRGVYNREDNEITKLLFKNLSIKNLSKRPFGNLSSGEKKKVMLYRGLLKNPDIILFDEFTQSLDLPSKKEIETIVKKLQIEFNKTIIWVSHDLNEIQRICDQVILIENGRIKESRKIVTNDFGEIERLQNMITA